MRSNTIVALIGYADSNVVQLFGERIKCVGCHDLFALFPEMWNIGYSPFNEETIFNASNHDELEQHRIGLQSQAIDRSPSFIQHFVLMLKCAEITLTPNTSHLNELRISQFKVRSYENMLGLAMANYAGPQNNGRSCAFDGMVCRTDGSDRDPLLTMADENEGIFLADFDIEQLRQYRSREIWGNAFRKPKQYAMLTSCDVAEPFCRSTARRNIESN